MPCSPGQFLIRLFFFFIWFILVKGSTLHFYPRIIASTHVRYVLRYETLLKAEHMNPKFQHLYNFIPRAYPTF